MTKREVGILACRILAVYAWIQALHYVPAVLGLVNPLIDEWVWSAVDVYIAIAAATPIVLLFAGAWFLWRRAGLVAAWMFGHDLHDHQFEPDSNPQRIRAEDLHLIAFSTLGLWLLLDAIPRAVSYATQIIYTGNAARHRFEYEIGFNLLLMSTSIDLVIRIVAGFWLLFGARGLVHFLRRLRTASVKPNSPGVARAGCANSQFMCAGKFPPPRRGLCASACYVE